MRFFGQIAAVVVAVTAAIPAAAQTVGAPKVPEVPPPGSPERESVAAKKLFGSQRKAADLKARSIGYYSRGCLAGGKRLPETGPAWQAMRLSRNRNWGHPVLVDLVMRLANEVKRDGDWPGLLVGDLSQPRGGPMLTGHRSHQLGLDADIWLTPMPDRVLSYAERERMSAVSTLGGKTKVNPDVWSIGHVLLIRRAASYREVQRILVHPAIKKALCEAAGKDRKWLRKVRPYWGHHYHMHVRIKCPKGSPGCKTQRPPPGHDGCGKELDDWFALLNRPPRPKPKPSKPTVKPKPKPPKTLAWLPAQCRTVLNASDQLEHVAIPLPALRPKSLAVAAPAPVPQPVVAPAPVTQPRPEAESSTTRLSVAPDFEPAAHAGINVPAPQLAKRPANPATDVAAPGPRQDGAAAKQTPEWFDLGAWFGALTAEAN